MRAVAGAPPAPSTAVAILVGALLRDREIEIIPAGLIVAARRLRIAHHRIGIGIGRQPGGAEVERDGCAVSIDQQGADIEAARQGLVGVERIVEIDALRHRHRDGAGSGANCKRRRHQRSARNLIHEMPPCRRTPARLEQHLAIIEPFAKFGRFPPSS